MIIDSRNWFVQTGFDLGSNHRLFILEVPTYLERVSPAPAAAALATMPPKRRGKPQPPKAVREAMKLEASAAEEEMEAVDYASSAGKGAGKGAVADKAKGKSKGKNKGAGKGKEGKGVQKVQKAILKVGRAGRELEN